MLGKLLDLDKLFKVYAKCPYCGETSIDTLPDNIYGQTINLICSSPMCEKEFEVEIHISKIKDN